MPKKRKSDTGSVVSYVPAAPPDGVAGLDSEPDLEPSATQTGKEAEVETAAALACVLRLLARREHSELELRHKLLQRRYRGEVIESVVATAREEGWLDEDRFVEHFIQSRVDHGDGPLKILAALQQRGIAEARIPIDPRASRWFDQIGELWRRRYGDQAADPKEQMRRWRFFRSRGFTEEQIATVVKRLW